MVTSLPESLVRDCLYNWLGFGNLDGPYWIIGREESFSLKPCKNVNTWREYFEVRREFDLSEDFADVWETRYGRSVSEGEVSGVSTRRYQAALVLALRGESVTTLSGKPRSKRIRDFAYEFPELGRSTGDNLSGELLPLPKKSKSTISRYEHIWPDVESYHREVLPKRVDLLCTALEASDGVEILVTYTQSSNLKTPLLKRYEAEPLGQWEASGQEQIYDGYRLTLDNGRDLVFVDTPFFGFGQVSYDGIERLANSIRRFS